jgi:hypothetical protein
VSKAVEAAAAIHGVPLATAWSVDGRCGRELMAQAPVTICLFAGRRLPLAGFLFVRPAGRTHWEVQVLYTPDKGKC